MEIFFKRKKSDSFVEKTLVHKCDMTDKFEHDLLHGIVNKQQESFEAFYKKYYRRMYILAYKYLGDALVAEEVTNDVFLKIWENAARLHITQSIAAYLSKSIVNASLNYIQKNKLETERQREYLYAVERHMEGEDEAEKLELYLLQLEKALEGLPPQCRKVIVMSKFDKLKQQQIADELQISLKTVKNHISIAYEKIRLYFDNNGIAILIFILFHFAMGLFGSFLIFIIWTV
jgi:RNA polymerase sigma-70 factor (ECF subfamily)